MKEAGVFVALLRGVNVGGNNMIKMSSLKASFENLGFTEVSTYINSGNIIFKSRETDARKLERQIEQMIDMLAQAIGAQHEAAGPEGALMQALDRVGVVGLLGQDGQGEITHGMAFSGEVGTGSR